MKTKCYSVVLNKSMCEHAFVKSWSKERSCVEVISFESTWGKFVVISSNKERHLFNIKPNVMLTYTSNTKSAYPLERNVIRHTHIHAAGSHTLYT